jgi:PPOX class probable F420-dependent enzyme
MELDAALDFIRSRQHGVLTTLKRDGRPQLSNITYSLGADGIVRISVTDGRAKTTNIRRDNRVSLHVSQEDFWAYVVIEADADLSPVASAPTTRPSTSSSSTTGRLPASIRTGTSIAG